MTRAEQGGSAALIGEKSLLIRCGEILIDRGIGVAVVVSRAEDIQQWCAEAAIPCIAPGADLTERLGSHRFDYLFSVTNLDILPDAVLDMATTMAINFHDGPLPAYAGLHATTWAIINGEERHGVTWHVMESGVDEGDLVEQAIFDVAADETAQGLNVACYQHAISSFERLADAIVSDGVDCRAQDLSGRSYFGRRKRPSGAGTIDWSAPTATIDRLVRALDFGQYENPLAMPKILIGDRAHAVGGVAVIDRAPGAEPGTIVSIAAPSVTVATADGRLTIESLSTPEQRDRPAADVLAEAGLAVGDRLPIVSGERATGLADEASRLARHEADWVAALERLETIELPYARNLESSGSGQRVVIPIEVGAGAAERLAANGQVGPAHHLVGAFAAFLARLGNHRSFDLASMTDGGVPEDLRPWFADQVPLRCEFDEDASHAQAVSSIAARSEELQTGKTFARDMPLRYPQLGSLSIEGGLAPIAVAIGGDPAALAASADHDVVFQVSESGDTCWLIGDETVFPEAVLRRLVSQLTAFIEAAIDQPDIPFPSTSLLGDAERHQVVVEWNETAAPIETETVPAQFMAAARRHPASTAVTDGLTSLTYAELDERSDRLSRRLRQLGVGPNQLVGIMVTRRTDMVVGLLGILKAGGAYVPLDPSYPKDRLAFMASDSQFSVLVVDDDTTDEAPPFDGHLVAVDAGDDPSSSTNGAAESSEPGLDDTAYVIYTSGSTGRPKGVVVTHRNLVNFLDGMNDYIESGEDSTWLTVTSLSFDISLLEIFWSLTRGLRLVVHDEALDATSTPDGRGQTQAETEPIGFSLFYFASDESDAANTDKYRLLLEGAAFADEHGFEAVWTPERHFHAFGGLYPNPAVTGAAIAAVTENVAVRAGSCVLPLHHPARVAEEWAIVDNLSKGRAGIAFAAGWQPDDFVLRPETFADRKEAMFRDIETVKQLWRGEAVTFDGPNGPSTTTTLPHPIQPELPTWITAAGNPATYEAAGRGGHNILTHLLGQSVEEVATKVAAYRAARAAAGHEGPGHVTLMLHTFLGEDIETVKEMVRPPMTDYLRSSVDLIREAAWSFPTFKEREKRTGHQPAVDFDAEALTEEEMEALLDHAFERYFVGSALFGTVESCTAFVGELKAIGVDEIACQIDFGLATSDVLDSLPMLDELRAATNPTTAAPVPAPPSEADDAPTDRSIPALMERYDVTHFQCTPSMGTMLVADSRFRRAARGLQVWLMGGEAFPQALAQQARAIVDHDLVNVYGPTETTIWSSAHRIVDADLPVSIGRPLANQQMYVVDSNLEPCPIGVPGELLIGGDGVTDGYLHRAELTDERFVPDRFRQDVAGAKLYRTGDLVRQSDDGDLAYLGRMDLQVKVRGYRIELGEIETRLDLHPSVSEAVVVAREDRPGDQQLVAYLLAEPSQTIDADVLREHLSRDLPEFMIPSRFVSMTSFPLTPNKKTDRLALPAPEVETVSARRVEYVEPAGGTEAALAKIWQDLLSLDRVGIDDNFFDLGGHSLLAVQLNRIIEKELGSELSITDVFRYPTVAALAARLSDSDEAGTGSAEQSADRGHARRRALAGRRRSHR